MKTRLIQIFKRYGRSEAKLIIRAHLSAAPSWRYAHLTQGELREERRLTPLVTAFHKAKAGVMKDPLGAFNWDLFPRPQSDAGEISRIEHLTRQYFGTRYQQMLCGHYDYKVAATARVLDPEQVGPSTRLAELPVSIRHCSACRAQTHVKVNTGASASLWLRRGDGAASFTLVDSAEGDPVPRAVSGVDSRYLLAAWTPPKGKGPVIGNVVRGGYHSTRNRGYRSLSESFHGTTFGVEMEIMPARGSVLTQAQAVTVVKLAAPDKLDVERDGSVEPGFEVVTGFGAYDDVLPVVRAVYESGVPIRRTARAGLHVHVGNNTLWEPYALRNEALLVGQMLRVLDPLHTSVAGRTHTRYCLPLAGQFLTLQPARLLQWAADHVYDAAPDRYRELNLKPVLSGGPTYEWRRPMMQPTLTKALAQLQFIRTVVDFVRNAVLPTADSRGVPTPYEYLEYVASYAPEQTAALRRVVCSRPVRPWLTAATPEGRAMPVAYNGRRDFQYCV